MTVPAAFQLVTCVQALPCDGRVVMDTARAANMQAVLLEARERMQQAGFWRDAPEPILVVLDASLPAGVLALTVNDAALHGLPAYPGRQAMLMSGPMVEQDLDVLLHELTHVWLRGRLDGTVEARWHIQSGRASHDSALLHEALADVVSASLTGDARVGEQAQPHGVVRSLDVAIACPEALTGQAYSDALLVSHPLWVLSGQGQDAAASAHVLHALADLLPADTRSIPAFLEAFPAALGARAPALAERWQELASNAQLHRCQESLTLSANAKIAREGDFIAPGMVHFPGQPLPQSLLAFEAVLQGGDGVRVSLRSSVPGPLLSLQWQALGARREVLAQGLKSLEGWPSRFVDITLPEGSRTLSVGVVNASMQDVGFNNIVLHTPSTGSQDVEALSSRIDFAPWVASGGLLLLVLLLLKRRWRRG